MKATDTPKAAAKAPDPDVITLYISGEIHNVPEPCGCTTEPLGDVARLAQLVRAEGGRAVLLDTGGLRYNEVLPTGDEAPQAHLKSDFLLHTMTSLGAIRAVQPEDLLDGTEALQSKGWVAANLSVPGVDVPATALLTVDGPRGAVRIGVIGVASPEGPWPAGIVARDPRPEVGKLAAGLRQKGADLIVALTGLSRPRARQLAAAPGLDVVVAGDHLEEPIADPEQVGDTLLVMPVKEAQHVVRLRFHVDKVKGKPVVRLFRETATQAREIERLGRTRGRLADQLVTLRGDPAADPTYVSTVVAELARTEQTLALAKVPATPPAGGYVTMELVPLSRSLPRDAEVAKAMAELDRRIGAENLKQVKTPPPPPLLGQPAYVGTAGCLGSCHNHDDGLAQWKGTVHAHAWKTLVDGGKQFSYDCVKCHVTGFGELGGSNLFTLATADRGIGGYPDLRDVGCEVCHGPGSLHVRSPVKVNVPRPKPDATRCGDCHTKEHSDTFVFEAYLRDVLGPGHGEERRKALGAGPTGAELRKAGLARAKAAGR